MTPFALFSAIGMPLAMGIGGIVAWRATRNQQAREDAPRTWRDDSLDEWRRERDARADEQREQRTAAPRDELNPESRQGEETSERQHTRLGG